MRRLLSLLLPVAAAWLLFSCDTWRDADGFGASFHPGQHHDTVVVDHAGSLRERFVVQRPEHAAQLRACFGPAPVVLDSGRCGFDSREEVWPKKQRLCITAKGEVVLLGVAITPITSLTAGAPSELGGATTGSFYASADLLIIKARSAATATLNLVAWDPVDARWYKFGSAASVTTDSDAFRFVGQRAPTYWHVYRSAGSTAAVFIEQAYVGGGGSVSFGNIEPGAAGGGGGTAGLGPQINWQPSANLSSANPFYPKDQTDSSISETAPGNIWRVHAPAGSTWRLKAATSTAIPVGETLTISIRASTTHNPSTAGSDVAGGTITLTNADPIDTLKTGATVTPHATAERWLTIRTVWTAVSALGPAQIFMQLERVS